jgi:hypothetical protein
MNNQGMNMGMNNQGMNMGMNNQGMNMGMNNQGMNMGMNNQGMNMGMNNQGMNMGMNQGYNPQVMSVGIAQPGLMLVNTRPYVCGLPVPNIGSGGAIAVLILNIFFPGLGTMVCGCIPHKEMTSFTGHCCCFFWLGVAHLTLTFFSVGWILGIVLGCQLITVANMGDTYMSTPGVGIASVGNVGVVGCSGIGVGVHAGMGGGVYGCSGIANVGIRGSVGNVAVVL